MYVQTTKKSQLCIFLFLKIKLEHFDDNDTIQEQLQVALAPLKAQDFCKCSEKQWNHWPECKVKMKLNTQEKPHKLYHHA